MAEITRLRSDPDTIQRAPSNHGTFTDSAADAEAAKPDSSTANSSVAFDPDSEFDGLTLYEQKALLSLGAEYGCNLAFDRVSATPAA